MSFTSFFKSLDLLSAPSARATNKEVQNLMKVYDKDKKEVGLILSCTKTDNNYQCLLSMNKNYSGQDIDF